jgi:hypothetical protein
MMPASIPIPIPGGLHGPLPKFVKVGQKLSGETLADIDAAVADEFLKYAGTDLNGKTVAIGVGSRGIKQQPLVVRALVRELKAAGAAPFIVPAMGSHGGGNAKGQEAVLASYGMTEATMGAPVRASMDVVQLGEIADGTPVYCDKLAHGADYIIPVNRIKPHTSFRAKHESGLIKMLAIGLSKHEGATAMHFGGMQRFGEVLPQAAEVFLNRANVLFGVGMVENAHEDLRHVEFIAPGDFFVRDAALQALAKESIPQLLFDHIDLLIVDKIGKNISGAGMDPNVTGRTGEKADGFDIGPSITRIAVCDLTDVTEGNATGIGMADVTTQKVVAKADWTKTYVNIVTAGSLDGAKLPIVADTDRDAIGIGIRGCVGVNSEAAKIVRIPNTLELNTVWASEPMAGEIEANPRQEILSEPFDLKFDNHGNLMGEVA